MNKLLAAIVAILALASFTTLLFAADAAMHEPSITPSVGAKPAPVADAAAKKRADNLRERNRKARTLSGTPKKPDVPVVPAASTTPAAKPVATEPPAVTAKPAPAADAAAAKQRAAAKLRERNRKAKALSGTGTPKKTEVPATPAAPDAK